MSMTRRRFLTISAAALAASPAQAVTARWQGTALGAEASLTLKGPRDEADAALGEIVALIRKVETVFSLYDPASELSRLNRSGEAEISGHMDAVMTASDAAYSLTGGRFDPTVQAFWTAPDDAARRLGWSRVVRTGRHVRLGAGQALTFNGIAQGYATDLAAETLRRRGFGKALINIGEHRGLGGPWRLELSDPSFGPLGTRTLSDGAIATSSPGALTLAGGRSHIQDPTGDAPPSWSTISVEAHSAAVADALSTAFCLMDEAEIQAAARKAGVSRVTLVDAEGRLRTL